MNRVRMFGPLGASSGYGNAAKGFAEAFSQSDIPTKFQFGKEAEITYQEFMDSLRKYNGDTNVDFYLHGPPWSKHKSQAYKIGYFYWEADRLPINWERMINQVDELWVPCGLVETACRRAKFRGPIKVVPTPGRAWEHDQRIVIPSDFSDNFVVSEDVFKFYSIFQWTERKNPKCMLQAYWSAFTKNDNVMLVLKAYGANDSPSSINLIRSAIRGYKAELAGGKPLYDFPPVYLLPKIISDDDIAYLHNTGHCLVSTARGEGWNISAATAILMNKPIISSVYGGVVDFLDKTEYYAANSDGMIPVSGMPWIRWYTSEQHWGNPNCASVSHLMREVFNEQIKVVAYRDIGMNIVSVGQLIRRIITAH